MQFCCQKTKYCSEACNLTPLRPVYTRLRQSSRLFQYTKSVMFITIHLVCDGKAPAVWLLLPSTETILHTSRLYFQYPSSFPLYFIGITAFDPKQRNRGHDLWVRSRLTRASRSLPVAQVWKCLAWLASQRPSL